PASLYGKACRHSGHPSDCEIDLAGQVLGGAMPASRQFASIWLCKSSRDYSNRSSGAWAEPDPGDCDLLLLIAAAPGGQLRSQSVGVLGALAGLRHGRAGVCLENWVSRSCKGLCGWAFA